MVIFDDVSFFYFIFDGVILVLSYVNLILCLGIVMVLVWLLGLGKLILVMMFVCFCDLDFGVVCIGGVDFKDVVQNDFYWLVFFVFQDLYMQCWFICDVIILVCFDVIDDQVCEVVCVVYIFDDIDVLLKGFDIVLGDDIDFLGGQKQWLFIVCVVFVDVLIFVFDEVMVVIDLDCEVEIQQVLVVLV